MSFKSLLALALVGALALLRAGSAEADPCPPGQPRLHTLTIYNGGQVIRQNFVLRDGPPRNCEALEAHDVFFRDCPRSPWRYHGTFRSARRAEEVACSLRANGKLALVRHHCG